MRLLLALSLFLSCIALVSAHAPFLVTQESLHDIVLIERPEVSRAFYGEMQGFPHTFEIRTTDPFHLYVEVLMPDIDSSKNNVSGIIIKETGNKGRVEEVARLLAKDATWESFYEPFGGDSYRRGSSFERDVDPGVYRIEVSTPDNLEKYVLVVGKIEDSSEVGYFETVRRLTEVKAFFGKSKLRIIESPLVFVPLLVILSIGGALWYVRKRRMLTSIS